MDKLYIVVPTYNEQENIKDVVSGWYSVLEYADESSKLVIIDDGSRDATFEVLTSLKADFENLVVITKQNEGHGATVLFGYNYALENDADYIFQTDSDGQTNPEEFLDFWEKRKDFSVIIGDRVRREDGLSRVFVTNVLRIVVFLIFGVYVTDANTPFRLMSNEVLSKYIVKVPNKFNLSNVLLSLLFVKNKEKVLFLPITFKQRQGGVNSINFKKICKIGAQAVKDFREIKKTL